MNTVSKYLLLLSMIVVMAACSNDDEPAVGIPADAVYDIVTLTTSSSAGSTFEYQKSDDSPVITYTSKYDLAASAKQIDIGDRIIICYYPTDHAVYTSGPITLYGYVLVSNTSKTVTKGKATDYDDWRIRPIELTSMWRTGKFINIEAKIYLYEAQKPEKCELVVDQATIDADYPQLYFVYTNRTNNDGENEYGITTSFNIQQLWSKPTCKGVTVNYATRSGMKQQTFKK